MTLTGQQALTTPPAATEPTSKMTARDVLDGLHGRWPDKDYLFIEEAASSPDRQGRKIDALVVSLWPSRGFELDAIEVKVSLADYRRELAEPAKADWWWQHSHRFWVAVPTNLARAAADQLPAAWGLLAITASGKARVAVRAPRHDPTPLTWPAIVGLLRCAASAGYGALHRAEQRGHDRGYEAGKRQATHNKGRTGLDALAAKVAAYQRASGIDIATAASEPDARQLGAAVTVVQHLMDEARGLTRQLAHYSESLQRAGDEIRHLSRTAAQIAAGDLADEPDNHAAAENDGGYRDGKGR